MRDVGIYSGLEPRKLELQTGIQPIQLKFCLNFKDLLNSQKREESFIFSLIMNCWRKLRKTILIVVPSDRILGQGKCISRNKYILYFKNVL